MSPGQSAPTHRWLEPGAWLTIILVLSALIVTTGMKNAELREQLPVGAKDLYRTLAYSQTKVQIIDVREDLEEFDDTHIPGAIPFPGCDLEQTPEEVRPYILKSVPTFIVSEEGEVEEFERCREHFTLARNLEGGIEGWTDEGLPEDSGEWVAPKPGAGGGCL
jgi:rhodanese-related sulfurtransferase